MTNETIYAFPAGIKKTMIRAINALGKIRKMGEQGSPDSPVLRDVKKAESLIGSMVQECAMQDVKRKPSLLDATPEELRQSGTLVSLSDLDEFVERDKLLMDGTFLFNPNNNTLMITIDYPYEVDLDVINSHGKLIEWVFHLSEKTWMTTDYLHEFIERVVSIKKWKISL